MGSTMITPPSRYDRLSATALAIGPTAFGSACASTVRSGEAPFNWTISMYGASSWSITAARVMRIICATMTQVSVITGMAKARSNWPNDSMLLRYDSAGSQRSCTANTSTASVATRNSGTDTTATAPVEAARSNHDPRHTADAMPSDNAIGTENSAVTAASSSEFGSRLPISSPTGTRDVDDMPR